MKLLTYLQDGQATLGALIDDSVVALRDVAPTLPATMESFLGAGDAAMTSAREALRHARGRRLLTDVKLLAPVRHPRKFLGIGFNYASHVEEVRKKGLPIPDLSNQIWFNKQTSCVTGPYDPIYLPSVSEQLDFECELGIVIGRRCRHVKEEDARKVIAGYLVANDVSVRDWQLKAPTATLGKSFDTHGPIGPWLTTADEVPDPENLGLRTFVDGVVMQDGNTCELINRINAMIAYLTTVMTLEPGDILSTGTPWGVAAGRNPPPWLRAGQTVRTEIDGLGYLENPILAEPLTETTYID
jgi:2-keto-4-pentenoate hydratase/2-oxohepta-3-ene-1,7-dioic acid hydratase in catechol pathway